MEGCDPLRQEATAGIGFRVKRAQRRRLYGHIGYGEYTVLDMERSGFRI